MKLIDPRDVRPGGPRTVQELVAENAQWMHQNARYTFYRTAHQTPSFVIKSASTASADRGAAAALRREYRLLDSLNLPGVVRAISLIQTDDALALVLEDAGQQNVAALLGGQPLALAEFWDMALQLAGTVASLHAADIIHCNIQPANVVWDAPSRRVSLIDFGNAMTVSTVAGESGNLARPEESLAYVSPEQTGRTGRSVDTRSDLYSLGATFYAMLTGEPPFTAHDPIELIHAQLARVPQPPHALNAAIPPVLSDIVLKLLEKEPQQRYLTADGLLADLQTAGALWSQSQSAAGSRADTGGDTIAPFVLARHDVPRQLSIPRKLYGRTEETAMLAGALERLSMPQREIVLVAGAPGIGKSALVRHLEELVVGRSGYFIAGKFDQLQRSVPYEGLVQAFRMLVRQLLTEPDAALALWRERIQSAVVPNAQILVDVIPEIEHILGPQAAVVELGQVESKNRFTQVFTSFINVFARPEHPFVLFLDDLQWVDGASLRLIEAWIADRTTGALLVAGAYREDEVGLAHPLRLALADLRKANLPVAEIHLAPLRREHVAELIADTLNQRSDTCLALADLMLKKTAGNPFFIKRLLHALHDQSLFRFDAPARAWQWEMAQIESVPVSDNVLDLMVQAIARLPPAASDLLQIGACIGYRFDLGTLAAVTKQLPTEALSALLPALNDGLLLPLQDAYGVPVNRAPLDRQVAPQPVAMEFVHDRVQQAAYSLLPVARRSALHLDIGRHLLHDLPQDQRDGNVFEVVHHLNRGASLITDGAERQHLARLNLAAGRKAKSAAAYQAGVDYLTAGKQLLPADAWTALPALCFALHRELAECAYLTGQHVLAEAILEAALQQAPTRMAKADLYSLRVLAATVAGDWTAALRWGREGLAVFGHAWPLDELADANDAEALAVTRNVGTRRIGDLVNEAEAADQETRACMRLLSLLGPPAYFSGSEVLTFLVARGVNLSLLHGPSVYSAYAYVFYGALHNARTGDYELGYAFGTLALGLAQRFDNRAEESRVVEVFGLVVHVWKADVRDSLPLMKEGYRAGIESGELAYAAFNLCGLLINGLPAGVPLADLLADSAAAVEFADKHKNRTAVEISLPFRQFARVMMGSTTGFDDDHFEEKRFLAEASGNQTAIGQFWVARLQAAYLLGDLDGAQACAREAEKCIFAGILGMITSAEYAFYAALTLAARYDATPDAARPALRDAVAALHGQFLTWSRHCPGNFLHKEKIIAAERERMTGSPWKAMELFGDAIELANQSGFIQDAAVANELACRLFLSHKQPRHADIYFRAAIEAYRLWGATAKIALLEAAHRGRLALAPDHAGRPLAHPDAPLALDALGIIKASHAIAAELVPERLFERILQIVVEVAGAQTGVLLLGDAGALNIRARIGADQGAIALEDTALADCPQLPRAIVRYVARTKEALVLDDAAGHGPFAADLEVRTLGLRSVLCVPLIKQVQVVGMLYLENNAMTGAFTSARVEVAQALAAQAAVSLQNSTLLLESARAERELRQLANDLSHESQRKTKFLATLAHELRNPLAPIRTGLDLMRASGNNPATLARVQEMMGRQLDQMVHLIDDLLDIARINSGKVQLKMELVDLRDAILSALEVVTPSIKAAQLELEIAMPDVPSMLHADPTRLAQILSNLLTNAAKYTPRRGKIKVAVEVLGSTVQIVVTDTGIGIAATALPEVFNMFNQVSKGMGRSQGGLGIGLFLVRSLVQMHGGSVSAASPGEGQGSVFTVHLPLAIDVAIDAPQAATSVDEMQIEAGTSLQVLVADDNVDAALMMMALLEMGGHVVTLVHDGRHAVAKVQAMQYDLAILDIGMPGLNGHQVAEAIRAMPGRGHTYLAALTGWGAEEDRQRSALAGFDAHLTKPAGIADINRLIAAALRKR